MRLKKRMKHFISYLLCAASTCSLCCGDVTKPSAEDRSALENTSRFHELYSTSELPSAIVALCAGDNNKIAEPGRKWNATDAIIDPTLPGKRLIWAAAGNGYYVVHYERGGIAHTYHILVAKLTSDGAKPKPVWRAIGGPFKNYAAFIAAWRGGKLDDRMDYAH
jgi:hypothetical protein